MLVKLIQKNIIKKPTEKMPDITIITMCPGTNCPHKETCYRYTAKPSEGWTQAYFTEPPIKDGKCDMYWGKNAEAVWNQLKEITK
jgi:histone acetyltransferase (RNA polymerase elongator complex component)